MSSDNLPEVRRDQSREVARTDTDSWIDVVGDVAGLAQKISGTEFVPKSLRNNVAATAAAILYGREVGLPPMTTLTQTHVIEGKPAMSAEAMRAMVFAAGHQLAIDETTGAVCRIRGRRAGTDEWTTIIWTLDMARAAGVASKQVWKSYPRQMLQARATTELCRLLFPDVIHGFRSVEELDVLDGVVVEDGEGNTAPAESATTVTRKRASRKRAPSTVSQAPVEASVTDGPPLPGEPGFDDVAPAPAPAAEGSEPVGGEAEGEAADPPTGDQDSGDVVDAEVVEEEPPPPLEEPAGPRGEVDTQPKPGPSTRAQHRLLFTRLDTLGVGEDERHRVSSVLIGREIDSFNRMSREEAGTLIETLSFIEDRAALDQLVRGVQERQS